MSPILAVVGTAFDRAAMLMEKGTPPAKAMRQALRELQEHEKAHTGQTIPPRLFTDELVKVPA